MVIKNGENGYLVPVGDYQRLAERITEALSDKTAYARMREGALKTGELFTPSRILEEWTETIRGTCRA
jgi:glycosyltransferase involved in cell wall biosynthesis